MHRTLSLYPWTQALAELMFWQPVWFLYFEGAFSADLAIFLMAFYDVIVVVLETPTGYLSDRLGRRVTLMAAATAAGLGCVCLFAGGPFWIFLAGQALLALSRALQSGTDSALLYDTLAALNRAGEIAAQETKAFRFRYTALAASALAGGALAQVSMAATFLATAVAWGLCLVLIWRMEEPPRAGRQTQANPPIAQMRKVIGRMRTPVLAWVLVSAIGGHTIGHVPFIFGQPYVQDALELVGAEDQTPIAVGILTAAMMGLSVLASLGAPVVRRRFGLAGCFLLAHGIEAALVGAMAFFIHPAVAILMVVRMIPSALTDPYMMEAIQPRLDSGYRATYLSFQSLMSRIVFSITLLFASWAIGQGHDNLNGVLAVYFAAAVLLLIGLILTRRVFTDPDR